MAEAFFKNNSPSEGYLKNTMEDLYKEIFHLGDPASADQNYLYCGGFLNEWCPPKNAPNDKDNACGASIYNLRDLAQAHNLTAEAVNTLTADQRERARNVLINASKEGRLVIVRATYQGCNDSTIMVKDGYGHYMLVTGIDDNFVYVNDPYKPKGCSLNFNYKQYTIASFVDSWCNKDIDGKKYCLYVLISPKGKSLPVGIINSCVLLPDALVGQEYSAKLSAIYGVGTNYKWTVVGYLPDGLTLTPEGLITGKPTKEGTYAFKVRVYDEATNFSDAPASIKVSSTGSPSSLTITMPMYLISGNTGVFYNFTLSAAGGKTPYTWAVISGHLPSGLTLSSGGVISGTPTTAGSYSFTAKVKDTGATQQTASKEFSITILKSNNDPVISSIAVYPSSVKTGEISTITCIASDLDNDPLTYVWTKTGGSFSGSGSTVTWTAPSTAGTYTVTCSVSDGKPGGTASRSAILTVTESTTPLSITTISLPSGTVGVSYPATNLSATGGKLPYSWSWSGNTPPVLSLNTSGVISGTPTTAGTYNFTVKVTDSSSPQQTATKALSINITSGTLSAPTGLTATPKCDGSTPGIELKWNAVTGANKYEVYRNGSLIYTTGSNPYFWNTSGLTAGQNYQYQVKARNDTTTSDFSGSVTATAPNCSGYSISGRVTLNGSGLSGVTITLTGSGSTSTTTDSNGNYTFTGAQNGSYTITPSKSGYTFNPSSRSITVNNANVTGQDFTATQTNAGSLQVAPSDGLVSSGPQGGTFSPSSKNYTLSNTGSTSINWTASKSQSWVTLSSTSGTLSSGGSTTVTVSINSNANSLAQGNYSDTVSFINTTNSNGNTTRSVNLTVTGTTCTTPGSFTLSANAYCNTTPPVAPAVMLSWIASNGASSYDIYRNGSLYSQGITGTSFDNNANVLAGESYTYYVVAKNSCGNTQSNTVIATVPSNICSGSPSMPTAYSPGNTSSPGPVTSSTTVTLSWSSVSGATYYSFGVRDMVSNQLVVDQTGASTSYTTTLNPGGQYRWNVAACNSVGCSSYTTPLYFQTPSSTPPCNPPGNFTLSATPWWYVASNITTDTNRAAVLLSFGASSNASGYALYRNGSLIQNFTTPPTSYIDSPPLSNDGTLNSNNILAGNSYSYYVTASNACGTTNSNTVSFTETPFAKVYVPGSSSCGGNVRPNPNYLSTPATSLSNGTGVLVIGGPQWGQTSATNSDWWWKINSGAVTGWIWQGCLWRD